MVPGSPLTAAPLRTAKKSTRRLSSTANRSTLPPARFWSVASANAPWAYTAPTRWPFSGFNVPPKRWPHIERRAHNPRRRWQLPHRPRLRELARLQPAGEGESGRVRARPSRSSVRTIPAAAELPTCHVERPRAGENCGGVRCARAEHQSTPTREALHTHAGQGSDGGGRGEAGGRWLYFDGRHLNDMVRVNVNQ